MTETEKLKGLIGLCRAAGGVACGTDAALQEIRRGRAKFVLIASDASDRTRKQLTDKCKYYHVTCFDGIYSGTALADMLGRHSCCAAAAFTGTGPWEGVKNALAPTLTERTEECRDRQKG